MGKLNPIIPCIKLNCNSRGHTVASSGCNGFALFSHVLRKNKIGRKPVKCFTCITANDNPPPIIPCIISKDNPLPIIPCSISKETHSLLSHVLYRRITHSLLSHVLYQRITHSLLFHVLYRKTTHSLLSHVLYQFCGNSFFSIYMYNSNASLVAATLPSQFTCRSGGIYHSILSSWDIHSILSYYTTPYYHITLLSPWQDNPQSQHSYVTTAGTYKIWK